MLRIIDSLKKQKRFKIQSQGTSMLPILHPGDILFIRKISFQKIKVNDVILVKKNRNIFAHRVIYKQKYLITKGDNNLKSDGKILPSQIIGLIYQIKRNGKIINIDDIYLIQSTLYFQEIVRIKKTFEKEKVDFVFLKGLPLHLYYEGFHPRRIYADCDILIADKDIEKVEKIFKKLKYQRDKSHPFPLFNLISKKPVQYSFYKQISKYTPVIFDIHFHSIFMFTRYGKLSAFDWKQLIDKLTNKFLAEKRIVKIQNEDFPILSQEDLLIYLPLSFFHHNFRGIYRLEFLSNVIAKEMKKKDRNLSDIVKTIQYFRLQNFIYPVLLMLKKYFDTSISENFLLPLLPFKPKLKFIQTHILKIEVFDGEESGKIGLNRFKNLFFLSPYPLWRKFLIVFDLQVIYSLFWIMIFFVRRSLVKLAKSS